MTASPTSEPRFSSLLLALFAARARARRLLYAAARGALSATIWSTSFSTAFSSLSDAALSSLSDVAFSSGFTGTFLISWDNRRVFGCDHTRLWATGAMIGAIIGALMSDMTRSRQQLSEATAINSDGRPRRRSRFSRN